MCGPRLFSVGVHAAIRALALLLCGGQPAPASAAVPAPPAEPGHRVELTVETAAYGSVDLVARRWPGTGGAALLWIAPGYGFRRLHEELAARVAALGTDVWLVDLAEALFLPRGSAAMRSLSGEVVAAVAAEVHRRSGRRVWLVANGYAAIPALRGARAWQARGPEGPGRRPGLGGLLLFSPLLMAGLPPLGQEPPLVPVVRATSAPVWIFQEGAHAGRGQLPRVVAALESGGARVWVRLLPGINGLFYSREPDAALRDWGERLPGEIRRALALLGGEPVPAGALPLPRVAAAGELGIDTGLRPYRGSVRPTVIRLPRVGSGTGEVTGFTGRVTVVNFWATWCPPCVREIPSLNRLRRHFAGRPFSLVSIDYAESPERVRAFLDQVEVDFPVLLDRDGRTAAAWKVVGFPSTFVIAADGSIRYGVNAAIEWDAPEVLARLEALVRAAEGR